MDERLNEAKTHSVTTPKKRRFQPDYRPSEPDSGLRRYPRRSTVKPDQALAVIRECKGVLADAARSLGMARSSLLRMCQNNSRLARELKNQRETFVDRCEVKLAERVELGDTRAIIYALSTVGRNRGYSMGEGSALNIGDTTTVMIQSVNIVSVPSGHHFDFKAKLIAPGDATVIDHKPDGEDERLRVGARSRPPN
jgi:hypothetical protein